MTESTAKKITTTIRFDADLHEALNDFVHDAGKGKNPKNRPSKDSIVQAAVRAHLTTKATSEVPVLKPVPPTEQVPADPQSVREDPVNSEESPWVNKLLAVLRSNHDIAREAIQKNLVAFELLAVGHELLSARDASSQPGGISAGTQAALNRKTSAVGRAKRVAERTRGDRSGGSGNRKRVG